MDTKYSKYNWLWPDVDSVASARKAAYQGMYVSLLISGITLILIGLSTQGINPLNLDLFGLVDVFIFLLVAWRIYAMSRIAPIIGLGFYILNQVIIMSEMGFNFSFLTIVISLAFINSIRGTFAYHKSIEQPAPEKNIAV